MRLNWLNHVKLSRWQADGFLLLITLIWGWTFVVMKAAISEAPVFSFLAVRFGLALLALLPLAWKQLHQLSRRQLLGGVVTGLFLMTGYSFQTVGLQYTTVSNSGFITGLYVVLVPLFSLLVLKRGPSRSATVGLVLATVGLVRLTVGPDLSIGRGDLLTIIGAVGYALHVCAVSRFGQKTDVMAFSSVQIATVFAGSLLLSGIADGGFSTVVFQADILLAAFLTGVVATALVLVLQTTAQRFTTPSQAAVVFTMEPLFAVMFGYLLQGERLTSAAWVGGLLILAGMLIAELGETVFHLRARHALSVRAE